MHKVAMWGVKSHGTVISYVQEVLATRSMLQVLHGLIMYRMPCHQAMLGSSCCSVPSCLASDGAADLTAGCEGENNADFSSRPTKESHIYHSIPFSLALPPPQHQGRKWSQRLIDKTVMSLMETPTVDV